MVKKEQKSFFTCQSCQLKQNVDQTVHISQDYCVRCYNKEQMHREMMKKFDFYMVLLREWGDDTKIRKKKIRDLIRLNEILLPQTMFLLENGEIRDTLHELQRDALKRGLKGLEDKYGLDVNEDAISYELAEKISPLWSTKRLPSVKKRNSFLEELEPFIDKKIEQASQFLKDLKNSVLIPYFTREKDTFLIKYMPPFQFNEDYLLRTVTTYRRRIRKNTDQRHRFEYFVGQIGQLCQFQTVNDAFMKAIMAYSEGVASENIQIMADRMLREINQSEKSNLIPNIAKYIMDNHEYIFESWFTKILPFDKSRFMASQARTGSRTDFIVRLQYTFRSYELKVIARELGETTELMLQEKARLKIAKIKADDTLTQEKKRSKIQRAEERLEKNLQPENLEKLKNQNVDGAPMVARYFLINSEKAFNPILNNIIRYHYKRLNIETEVQYITNVLESGAEEIRNDLKAYYIIHSREW